MRRQHHELLRTHIKHQIMGRSKRRLIQDQVNEIPEAAELARLNLNRGFWGALLPFMGLSLIAIPLFYLPVYPKGSLLWFLLWIFALIVYLDSSRFIHGFYGMKRWPDERSTLILVGVCLPAYLVPIPLIRDVAIGIPEGFLILLSAIASWLFRIQRRTYYHRWFFRAARIYFRAYQNREH